MTKCCIHLFSRICNIKSTTKIMGFTVIHSFFQVNKKNHKNSPKLAKFGFDERFKCFLFCFLNQMHYILPISCKTAKLNGQQNQMALVKSLNCFLKMEYISITMLLGGGCWSILRNFSWNNKSAKIMSSK